MASLKEPACCDRFSCNYGLSVLLHVWHAFKHAKAVLYGM